MMRFLILVAILLIYPLSTVADNSSYEERIAKQLSAGKSPEEVVSLGSNGSEFIALFRRNSTDQALGAVIILHGMGGHPDWPEVVNPLRLALPQLGWTTLSLQMPVLSPTEPIAGYGKTLGDAKKRLQAAVQQLQDWRFTNIVIIGYSFGAATAAHALSTNDIKSVKAFVGISMQAQQFLSPKLKLLRQLESIRIPVLDIYGSRDALEVLREVDDRRLAARKNGNSAYQQMVVQGADHYYTGLPDVLVKRIHGWLVKSSRGPLIVPEVGISQVSGTKLEAKTEE